MIGASRSASTRQYQVLDTVTNNTPTTSGSYTVPDGVVFIEFEVYGGGGGGGFGGVVGGRGSSTSAGGQGGGGGAYVKFRFFHYDIHSGDEINYTVGHGGTAGPNELTAGGDGGDSKITKHMRSSSTITLFGNLSAGGGGGGASRSVQGSAGVGGDAVGGSIQPGGFDDFNIYNGQITVTDGTTAPARFSDAGGGVAPGNTGGTAAGPDGGGGGAGASISATAGFGGQPGGGGGGGRGVAGSVAQQGATGQPGRVIIKSYG